MPARTAQEAPFRQATAAFGEQLRSWRQRRRMSQLELAGEADISTRHLSYVETGRANPSREMVLRLAARLEVPLRERNSFLLAAGYAPMYRESRLDDPAFAAAKQAVELILKSHEPFPALAIDRRWNLVAANGMVAHLLAGVHASLLQPPMNVLRVSLDPGGLAPNIINLAQWRAHLFERLSNQIAVTADPALISLLSDLRKLPAPESEPEEFVQGEHAGHRRAPEVSQSLRGSELHQHHDDFRISRGHHLAGTGPRNLLSVGRVHTTGAAELAVSGAG